MSDPFAGLPRHHYGAILADPPWSFRSWSGKTGTAHRTSNDHYITRSFDELCLFPVVTLGAKDCALFLWVVDSHLEIAMRLGRAWGFEFKTRGFTWRKLTSKGNPMIGMGYWTRKQTELCLIFTRGKPKVLNHDVRELIDAPRREHSRKPDEIYPRIERLVAGPYLDLFARSRRDGWSSWGNETDRFPAVP